jgi:hypothetical protein
MDNISNAQLAAILRCILGACWRGDAPLDGRGYLDCVKLAADRLDTATARIADLEEQLLIALGERRR